MKRFDLEALQRQMVERLMSGEIGRLMIRPGRSSGMHDLVRFTCDENGRAANPQKPVEGSETTITSIVPYLGRKAAPEPASGDYGAPGEASDITVGTRIRILLPKLCKSGVSHGSHIRYNRGYIEGTVHHIASPSGLGRYQATDGHPFWVTHEAVQVPGKPTTFVYGGWFGRDELEVVES